MINYFANIYVWQGPKYAWVAGPTKEAILAFWTTNNALKLDLLAKISR